MKNNNLDLLNTYDNMSGTQKNAILDKYKGRVKPMSKASVALNKIDEIKESPEEINKDSVSRTSSDESINSDSEINNKMFGVIPKTAFWIGVSVIGLSIAGFITYKIVKHKR